MGQTKIFSSSDEVIKKIYIEDPIYTSYILKEVTPEVAVHALYRDQTIDSYCIKCHNQSIFHVQRDYKVDEAIEKALNNNIFNIIAECTRKVSNSDGNTSCSGKLIFTFILEENLIIKAGQYPSKADLDFDSLDPVFKHLDPSLRKELGSAIGLRAHGVGVGSFVYLRRIFEKLIEEAYNEAKEKSEWDNEAYEKVKNRMSDKIQFLKSSLPLRLVENSHLYGVLSKGIHELSEEECLEYFGLIKTSIEMILRERDEKKKYNTIVNKLKNISTH